MRGIFCFDDAHSTVKVRLRGRIFEVCLHIALTINSREGENGLLITPERKSDRGLSFLVFAHGLELGSGQDLLVIDAADRQVFWQFSGNELVATAVKESLRSWDGQELSTLRDDMARIGIATAFDRFVQAAGTSELRRFSGQPIRYQEFAV